jgi:stress-induced morphogen
VADLGGAGSCAIGRFDGRDEESGGVSAPAWPLRGRGDVEQCDAAERYRRDKQLASHRKSNLRMGGGTITMTTTTTAWETKRTAETRAVEDLLRQHFKQVDAYRYNAASIRIRVINPQFEGTSREKRDAMVEQYLDLLPLETQKDIITLITFAPSDLEQHQKTFREHMLNTEFDDPSPSKL